MSSVMVLLIMEFEWHEFRSLWCYLSNDFHVGTLIAPYPVPYPAPSVVVCGSLQEFAFLGEFSD